MHPVSSLVGLTGQTHQLLLVELKLLLKSYQSDNLVIIIMQTRSLLFSSLQEAAPRLLTTKTSLLELLPSGRRFSAVNNKQLVSFYTQSPHHARFKLVYLNHSLFLLLDVCISLFNLVILLLLFIHSFLIEQQISCNDNKGVDFSHQ